MMKNETSWVLKGTMKGNIFEVKEMEIKGFNYEEPKGEENISRIWLCFFQRMIKVKLKMKLEKNILIH